MFRSQQSVFDWYYHTSYGNSYRRDNYPDDYESVAVVSYYTYNDGTVLEDWKSIKSGYTIANVENLVSVDYNDYFITPNLLSWCSQSDKHQVAKFRRVLW